MSNDTDSTDTSSAPSAPRLLDSSLRSQLQNLRTGTSSRAERAYMTLAGIFLGALVITNAIAGKFFVMFGQELSAGIIAYPVTFLVTDLISEVYGRERAALVVKVGFLVSVFITAIIGIALMVPTFEQSPVTEEQFSAVFGLVPGIVLGSMIAYLVAQLVDVYLFEFWRNLTSGDYLWLRNNGSTFFSQAVDTVLVVTIALVIWPQVDGNPNTEPLSWAVWQGIVLGQYFFKLAIAAIDTPLVYVGRYVLLRWISQEDAAAPQPEVNISS